MTLKTLTFLLLLLGLSVPVLSDKCPDKNRLPTTCQCEDVFVNYAAEIELSCSGASIGELSDALRLLNTNSRLDVLLDDMKLQSLPSRVFDGWNVVILDISHCQLDSLSPEGEMALAGLEDKLESLTIISSFTEDNQPTKIDLSHLRRLRELDLSLNAITELSDDWFDNGPTSLTTLMLSNNAIEKIGDRAFANLVNLDQLWLDGNRFGSIKRSMLPIPATRLENMKLGNNAFTSLPDDLFTDMPALKDLSIRTNRMVHLSERVFKPIWSQLNDFDARGNPLECDSTMEWLFNVRTKATVLGTCEDPLGGKGVDLEDFIKHRGQ